MNEIELKNEFLPYPESLLEAWTLGDYSMLTHSNASDYIKKILTFKAKNRTGRRFFGEAFIASNIWRKHCSTFVKLTPSLLLENHSHQMPTYLTIQLTNKMASI